MGLFFRRSIRLNKYARINLSKHGIGYSFGPKGFKVGKSSTGHTYVSGGKGGVYFHENLDKGKTSMQQLPQQTGTQAFNLAEKPVLGWYVAIIVIALIIAALVKSTVVFWVLFGLDCVMFLGLTVTNVKNNLLNK